MGLERYLGSAWSSIVRRFRRIRWQVLTRLRSDVTVRTRHGTLTVSTHDTGISPSLFIYREVEYGSSIRCMRFLREQGLLPAGEVTLYDIGANIGFIGIGLLNAGVVDRVVAFEPDPQNFRLLERNVEQNGLADRVVARRAALSSVSADLEFELSPTNVGDHRVRSASSPTTATGDAPRADVITVEGITLNDFVSSLTHEGSVRQPSALWVDVQGHEGFVFHGGLDYLRMARLPVITEIWPYGIVRAGMSMAEFVEIVQSIWPFYWVERPRRRNRGSHFVRYPIAVFDSYLDELGTAGDFGNVILTADLPA